MSIWNKTWVMALSVLLCSPAIAQQQADELDAKVHEAEQRLVEQEAELVEFERRREVHLVERETARAEALHEMHRVRAELERVMRNENIEVEIRIREAEASMVEAAQHMAELSSRQLPRVAMIERIIRTGHGPVLGITIGTNGSAEPVAGVTIRGISPGGAAGESGLRAGDVITSINNESLTADNDSEANEILLDFMRGVEEGDELAVEYLRNGRAMTVDVKPRPVQGGVFAFDFSSRDFTVPEVHIAPDDHMFSRILWVSGGGGLGDMEIVQLTEGLGRYFGTDEGLLIVRAPDNKEWKLQDGDVIRSIDGRKPTTVNHAMRILGSYESGETVNIEIMRDKRKQTISFEVPDNHRSALAPVVAPHALAAPSVIVVPKVLSAPEVIEIPAAPAAIVVPFPAERI
jgi:C-terminal processing protease CtpA/Prc